jgi:hypothetical protein
MPTPFRVRLSDELFPLQAFLNIWPDDEFLPMLRRMARGVESTYNDTGWSWWGGEGDKLPPMGELLFFAFDEELKVSTPAFLPHLQEAADQWSVGRPNRRDEINELVGEIERFFGSR